MLRSQGSHEQIEKVDALLRLLRSLAIVTLALSACDDDTDQETSSVAIAEVVAGPQDLSVPRPVGFVVLDDPDSVVLMEDADRRDPLRIAVSVTDSAPEDPVRKLTRQIDGQKIDIATRLVELEGAGSGGPEWRLTAWRASGGRWLRLDAQRQSEMGEPDFAPAWQVFDAARLN